MSQTVIKAVLFDLDGTLVDTAPDFLWALNQIRASAAQIPLSEAEIRTAISDGSAGLVRNTLGINDDDPTFERTRQQLLTHYFDVIGVYAKLYPGLDELLTEFDANGIAWGISTNKPSIYTNALLNQMALPNSPSTVVCPDHVSKPKPDPEPLLLNCQHLNLAPHQVVFVGDHIRDIQAGRAAGMHTLAAAWGYLDAPEEAENWNADAVCYRSEDLNQVIKDWR